MKKLFLSFLMIGSMTQMAQASWAARAVQSGVMAGIVGAGVHFNNLNMQTAADTLKDAIKEHKAIVANTAIQFKSLTDLTAEVSVADLQVGLQRLGLGAQKGTLATMWSNSKSIFTEISVAVSMIAMAYQIKRMFDAASTIQHQQAQKVAMLEQQAGQRQQQPVRKVVA